MFSTLYIYIYTHGQTRCVQVLRCLPIDGRVVVCSCCQYAWRQHTTAGQQSPTRCCASRRCAL